MGCHLLSREAPAQGSAYGQGCIHLGFLVVNRGGPEGFRIDSTDNHPRPSTKKFQALHLGFCRKHFE